MRKLIYSFLLFCIVGIYRADSQELPAYYVYLNNDYQDPSEVDSFIKNIDTLHSNYPPKASNKYYINHILQSGAIFRHSLNWLNAITIQATEKQIQYILSLPFVSHVSTFSLKGSVQTTEERKNTYALTDPKLDTLYSLYTGLMNTSEIADFNLSGKGVRIAIFDAGFAEALSHPALEHLQKNQQIILARDFYEEDDDPYHHSIHGTQVLGCIAGKYGKKHLGFAPNAEFLLARTEHEKKEFAYEEDHWIAALEWAEENGANIVSNSITFTDFSYSYADMDGQTSPVSKAAAIAAQKGLLIVSAMGNEGDSKWKFMGAPADVPEVLSIGGSMPMLPMHIQFASIGPNYKKERKPNISAPAYIVGIAKKGKYDILAGTSFSTPLIAGISACIKEAIPYLSGPTLFHITESIGHLYPYYDYYLGYGIPDMNRLKGVLSVNPIDTLDTMLSFPYSSPSTFNVGFKGDSVIIQFDTAFLCKDSLQYPNGRILYFHKEHPLGYLEGSYFAQIPNNAKYYYFRRKETPGTLRIWFEGYLFEFNPDNK